MKKYSFTDNYKICKDEFNLYNKFIKFCIKYLKIKKSVFDIVIVNNETIKKINKDYRKINKETDVITFAFKDDIIQIKTPVISLGEIYISYEKALSQAKEYGHSIQREMLFLIIHGILHLLSYDHINIKDEKVMFDLQERILEKYGFKRK